MFVFPERPHTLISVFVFPNHVILIFGPMCLCPQTNIFICVSRTFPDHDLCLLVLGLVLILFFLCSKTAPDSNNCICFPRPIFAFVFPEQLLCSWNNLCVPRTTFVLPGQPQILIISQNIGGQLQIHTDWPTPLRQEYQYSIFLDNIQYSYAPGTKGFTLWSDGKSRFQRTSPSWSCWIIWPVGISIPTL